MLPPCKKTLTQKIKSANMAAQIWGHEDTVYPSRDLNPPDYVWKKLNGVYPPLWFDGNSLPEDIRGQQEDETKPEEDEHLSPDSKEEAKKTNTIQEAEWSNSSSDEDDYSDLI